MSGSGSMEDDKLKARIEGAVACLRLARQALENVDNAALEEVGAKVETCARDLTDLPLEQLHRLQPAMLTLLDDLDHTISLYQSAVKKFRTELSLARRGQAAGDAYRQAEKI